MFIIKANIDPRVRAKFEELGVVAIRDYYAGFIFGRSLVQQDKKEITLENNLMGNNLMASGNDMREWLEEKVASDSLWIRTGVIAAVIAAVFAFLAWRFPYH